MLCLARYSLPVFGVLAAVGCVVEPDGDTSTYATLGTLGETDSMGTSSSTGDGDGDDPDPVDPDEGTLAEGIAIDSVEINQGVGIQIASGGQMLGANSWEAPLIGDRPGLMQVTWSLGPSFVPRPILARVTLTHADQSVDQFEQTLTISGPPTEGFLDGSFSFEFGPGELRGGDSLVVGLFDPDPNAAPATSGGSRLPAAGEAPLEVIGDPMRIKVMVVPATDPAVDGGAYNPSAEIRAMMETDLFNLYPVSAIEVEYHAPVAITNCYDGASILSQLSSYRNGEALGANVYYHAVFPNSHEGYCWAGGMAWLVDDGMGADRVSYSVNHWGESPNNFTHELGHSNGREHSFEDGAYQPSSSGSPDCGRRRTWGYPVQAGKHPKADEWSDFPPLATLDGWLIAPTEGLALTDYCHGHNDYPTYGPALNDVMSYAYPYWISAYTYRNLAARIQTLSSWDGASAAPSGESLHGVFLADGSVRWYRMAGQPTLEPDQSRGRVRGRVAGEAWESPLGLKRTGDGEVRGLIVPLPEFVEGELDIEFEGRELHVALDQVAAN